MGDSKTVAIGLVVIAAFSLVRIITQWRAMGRKRRNIDWDQHFIQQLRKAGVSAFEEHTIDFFFTVPERSACEQLAAELRQDGYSIDIRQDSESGRFSLDAQRRMRLAVPEMQAVRVHFTDLAARHGASYDNWAVATK
ncbi:MAG: ribonuclease E inhibitor RraB [Steroidobacteraceae bacterium]